MKETRNHRTELAKPTNTVHLPRRVMTQTTRTIVLVSQYAWSLKKICRLFNIYRYNFLLLFIFSEFMCKRIKFNLKITFDNMPRDLVKRIAIVELFTSEKSAGDIAKTLNVNRILLWRAQKRFKSTGAIKIFGLSWRVKSQLPTIPNWRYWRKNLMIN